MHPPECPGWEYNNHPQRRVILTARISETLRALISGYVSTLVAATDSRDMHRHIFAELTPIQHEYYAGHYRGEWFPCLRFYAVEINGDPRVGRPPGSVVFLMEELAGEIRSGIIALDSNALLTEKERLGYVVALAAHVFVAFLTIHPYANGNGHAGRLIVWSIMGRYGYWPKRWPVEPRPPDPPYTQLITECRNGNPLPLEQYLLQTLTT